MRASCWPRTRSAAGARRSAPRAASCVRRRGIDLAPVDATTDEGYLLLTELPLAGSRRARRPPGRGGRDASRAGGADRPSDRAGDYVGCSRAARGPPGDAVTSSSRRRRPLPPAGASRELAAALERPVTTGGRSRGSRRAAWTSGHGRRGRTSTSSSSDLAGALAPRGAYVDFHGNWLDWRLADDRRRATTRR